MEHYVTNLESAKNLFKVRYSESPRYERKNEYMINHPFTVTTLLVSSYRKVFGMVGLELKDL
jgi:hypothetical protein